MDDDFYIGYEPRMPAAYARRVRPAAALLLVLAAGLGATLVTLHARLASGTFEFGRTRAVVGRIVEFPYPALDVDGGPSLHSRGYYWLVGPGKHGAATIVRGLDGRRARVRGTLIARDGEEMLQIDASAIEIFRGETAVPSASPQREGEVRLAGEIVDGKCHLGVMKPGEGPTHRDCAVRCLLGGVPPLVFVHGSQAQPRRLALVVEDGGPFAQDLTTIAGRPLALRGTLLRQGARRFLSARASDIEAMR
jgi:hypothetical protein